MKLHGTNESRRDQAEVGVGVVTVAEKSAEVEVETEVARGDGARNGTATNENATKAATETERNDGVAVGAHGEKTATSIGGEGAAVTTEIRSESEVVITKNPGQRRTGMRGEAEITNERAAHEQHWNITRQGKLCNSQRCSGSCLPWARGSSKRWMPYPPDKSSPISPN